MIKRLNEFLQISFLFVCLIQTNYAFAGEHEGGNSSQGQEAAVKNKSRFLLSTIREGDFSHVGGSKAIELVLGRLIAANSEALKGNILEVGSGYGGSANFLKKLGYDKVQGIDIDEEAIKYAKEKYPNIYFKLADATKLTRVFEDEFFDVIYMIDIAHAIEDKSSLLQKVKTVSKDNALLAIMDYSLKNEEGGDKLTDNNGIDIYALNLKKLTPIMKYIGWEIVEVVDITASYKEWYVSILEKINLSKDELLSKGYSEEEIKFIQDKFSFLLNLINEGKVGGVIIIVRKQ